MITCVETCTSVCTRLLVCVGIVGGVEQSDSVCFLGKPFARVASNLVESQDDF